MRSLQIRVAVCGALVVAATSFAAPAFASVVDEVVMVNSSGVETSFPVTADTAASVSKGELGDQSTIAELAVDLPSEALTARLVTSEGFAPEVTEPEVSARGVIGADDRVPLNTRSGPGRHMAYLQFVIGGQNAACTGPLVGPSTIVTAAHCLHQSALGGWITSGVTAYFGVEGSQATHACTSVDFAVPSAWIQSNGDPIHDYGVIQLGCAHSAVNYGWMGYRDLGTGTISGNNWNVSGYPFDKPGITLWNASGSMSNSTFSSNRIRYLMDTARGQSGGPIWRQESGNGCTVCLVGVHTTGYFNTSTSDGIPIFNEGSRMTGNFKAAVDGYTGFGS